MQQIADWLENACLSTPSALLKTALRSWLRDHTEIDRFDQRCPICLSQNTSPKIICATVTLGALTTPSGGETF
jgi:hypothetical protein